MALIGICIFIIIPIFLICIAYYFDYKQDKKYFQSGMKGSLTLIACMILVVLTLMGVKKLYAIAIPLNRNYGQEYNSERIKLGIPIIEKGWKEVPAMGDQFRQWYISSDKNQATGHSEKMIEYGYFSALVEFDFYLKPKSKFDYFVKFDYDSKKKKYYKISKDFGLILEKSKEITFEEFMEE
jgi:hypothetical protein